LSFSKPGGRRAVLKSRGTQEAAAKPDSRGRSEQPNGRNPPDFYLWFKKGHYQRVVLNFTLLEIRVIDERHGQTRTKSF
jgi:hypothetical protein